MPEASPPEPPIRVRVRYTGRVQGVGFRATTRAVARLFPVTGWVRNDADGSVTAEFQGDPTEIDRCMGRLADEMASNIRSADRHEAPLAGGETSFEIAY